MPLYRWKCRVCGEDCEVARRPSEFEEPPGEDETKKSSESTCSGHDWERQIALSKVIRGPGWGKKGSLL